MKKILISLLVVSILMSLCACSPSGLLDAAQQQQEQENETPTTSQTENAATKDIPEEPQKDTDVQVTLESCRFADEVRASDGEYASMLYADKEGKVYIDTVLTVMTDSELDADAFKGYVICSDRRYDMQYCIDSYTGVAVNKDNIPAPGGRVHMFASVPDAAESEDLEAVVIVNGKEYKSKVEGKDTRPAFERKTQLKVGDKKSVLGGLVEFEVVSCKYTKVIQAQDVANTQQYTGTKPFVDLVLKITNNMEGEDMVLTNFFGYVAVGEENIRATCRMEIEDNTDLSLNVNVAPGNTEYVHIYTGVEETQDAGSLAMRFNLAGVCYYCYAQ